MAPTFDLVSSPWIPCIDSRGRRVELGLADALVRAHELTEVRDESPLTTAALLRLLLAVLYAALEGPRDHRAWKTMWRKRRFDENGLEKYLDAWRPRLDLFDEKHPFFQVGGFEIAGKPPTPVSKLTHELATGNSATLFDHSVEERVKSVTPAVAGRWLVTAQSFAVGGGVGATSNKFGKHPNFTHAPMVGGAAVFLVGENLFETLMLNLSLLAEERGGAVDRPTWEHDRIASPAERRPRGMMELLTWRSRMVRLVPTIDDGQLTVAGMYFASGWQCPRDVVNPFWAYTVDEAKGRMPIGFRSGRALWRDSSALLTAGDATGGTGHVRPAAVNLASDLVEREVLPDDAPLRCLTLGFANDKAKVLFWRREQWSVPPRLIRDMECGRELLAALGRAAAGHKALYAAMSRFGEAFKDGVPEARERASARYWGALDLEFKSLLAGLAADGENAIDAWTEAVKANARAAFDDHTENAQRRSARELRARVDGASMLAWKLKKLADGDEEAENGDE